MGRYMRLRHTWLMTFACALSLTLDLTGCFAVLCSLATHAQVVTAKADRVQGRTSLDHTLREPPQAYAPSGG